MAQNFLSIMWCGQAFLGLEFQDVESLILVGALFLLDGRRRREQRKKKREKHHMGEEGFPRAGSALLAVQQVTAVRCN
jgi:hypothetical protein